MKSSSGILFSFIVMIPLSAAAEMANAAARVSDRNNMIMIGKYLISENKDEVKRDPQRRQQCS